jgi:hypothetical protein
MRKLILSYLNTLEDAKNFEYMQELVDEIIHNDGVNAYHYLKSMFKPYHSVYDVVLKGIDWSKSIKGGEFWIKVFENV